MATPRTGRPVGRPPGTATGVLSDPERRGYAIELWRQGLSDERIAVACTRAFNTFISKNVVVGCRFRDNWQRGN